MGSSNQNRTASRYTIAGEIVLEGNNVIFMINTFQIVLKPSLNIDAVDVASIFNQ